MFTKPFKLHEKRKIYKDGLNQYNKIIMAWFHGTKLKKGVESMLIAGTFTHSQLTWSMQDRQA